MIIIIINITCNKLLDQYKMYNSIHNNNDNNREQEILLIILLTEQEEHIKF